MDAARSYQRTMRPANDGLRRQLEAEPWDLNPLIQPSLSSCVSRGTRRHLRSSSGRRGDSNESWRARAGPSTRLGVRHQTRTTPCVSW
jgi:hypothetical protein